MQEQGIVVSWKDATMKEPDMEHQAWSCLKSWCTYSHRPCLSGVHQSKGDQCSSTFEQLCKQTHGMLSEHVCLLLLEQLGTIRFHPKQC